MVRVENCTNGLFNDPDHAAGIHGPTGLTNRLALVFCGSEPETNPRGPLRIRWAWEAGRTPRSGQHSGASIANGFLSEIEPATAC